MKKITLLLLLLTAAAAQLTAQEPRPDWVSNPPFPPPGANYIFVSGTGVGATEKEAEFEAWKNALFKALNEGGLIGFKQQASDLKSIQTMDELNVALPVSVLKRRPHCPALPIYITDKKVKIYILFQVQREEKRSVDFYSHDISYIKCETDEFKRQLKEWNSGYIIRQKAAEEQAAKTKAAADKAAAKMQRRHGYHDKHNYLAWGVLNAGYPFTLGTSFAGRHGGVVGIGYYLSVGADIGYDYPDIVPVHYSIGLKFFPYKSIFLSAGYGTLGVEKMSGFNDSDGRWGTEGWRQGKGPIVMGGYDILVGGVFLSLGAGMSYDLFMEKWQPLINIKFGVAWGL